jgi:glycerol-3-phosphate dehydrogenase
LRLLRFKYPWLDPATARRWVRAYGKRAELILGNARNSRDLV